MSSDYYKTLDPPTQKRNREKILLIENIDPYEVEEDKYSDDISELPNTSYPDIVNYLVFSPSPYTADDMKAYKSLEAYNQVLEGWVRDVKCLNVSNLKLVRGKVCL